MFVKRNTLSTYGMTEVAQIYNYLWEGKEGTHTFHTPSPAFAVSRHVKNLIIGILAAIKSPSEWEASLMCNNDGEEFWYFREVT